MSKMSIKDLIAAKQKEIQAKKGREKTWKPAKGKSRVRILPSWRGTDHLEFWHDYGVHWVKDSKGELGAAYICTDKSFGRECPICQAIGQGIRGANDDATIDLLKEANASQRYLMNVLVLSDPDESKRMEPRVMECGISVFESILEIISEYDDITDLKSGVDLIITREGTSVKDTKYTVVPSAKSIEVPASIREKLPNLDEYVSQENEADLSKALTAVGRAAGLLTANDTAVGLANAAKTAALPDDSMASVLTEDDIEEEALAGVVDDEIVDASIEEVSATEVEDDIDDDELDALLNEM